MTMTGDLLPDDPLALRAIIAALQAELSGSHAELQQMTQERDAARQLAERLEHLLARLRRMQFGRRSEKIDPEQLELAFEDTEQAVAQVIAEQDKADTKPETTPRRRRPSGEPRPSLPPELPRVEVVVEPDSTVCPCCGGALHLIGEDRSERLDVVPAQYRVLVTRRPKYGCRGCEEAMVQAAAPPRLIEGGLPTEALVAQILVAKYADHTPLYRQAQGLARQGIDIARSTLAAWAGTAAAELKPLWEQMRAEILTSSVLFVDETTAPVLDPGRGRTKTGYLWAIARDQSPWGGGDPPAVIYSYAPGRGGQYASSLLAGFRGVLQTDGYQVYKSFALKQDAVTLAQCWAHVRRRFFDLGKSGTSPIAEEALRRIAALYKIEAEIRGQSAEQRKAARQDKSKPLAEALKLWLADRLATVSGKSVAAGAIRYALNHWDGLVRFLDDGRIEIDSNTVERAMRPIALNRKNALFAGSDEGGENWAMLASLIECCKRNDVNPATYLTDVLTKLVNQWPNSRIHDLTPWAWGKSDG